MQHILARCSTENIQLKEPEMSFVLSVLCVNQYRVLSDINVNQLGVTIWNEVFGSENLQYPTFVLRRKNVFSVQKAVLSNTNIYSRHSKKQ